MQGGERVTITTITDNEWAVESSTVIVAVIVHRNGAARETGRYTGWASKAVWSCIMHQSGLSRNAAETNATQRIHKNRESTRNDNQIR